MTDALASKQEHYADSVEPPFHGGDGEPVRVAYLFGAGATQGAIGHAGGTVNQLMRALSPNLMREMARLVTSEYRADRRLLRLVNELDEGVDFEHLITFFEDAPSSTLRRLGVDLKDVFATVLRERLDEVDDELGTRSCDLFAALIDMYSVAGLGEDLTGFLSLNYDTYLERAVVEELGRTVDYGLSSRPGDPTAVRILKLHGSFGWIDEWPPSFHLSRDGSLWIPPGIRKAKGRYPFNRIWGAALDLLDCDILRIVGCNLSANDWDLISLIFSSKFSHATDDPFEIEIIGSPATAEDIRARFPYLLVRSIYETPSVGPSMLSEVIGVSVEYELLTPEEKGQAVMKFPNDNAFEYWLVHMAEQVLQRLEDYSTPSDKFRYFADTYAGR